MMLYKRNVSCQAIPWNLENIPNTDILGVNCCNWEEKNAPTKQLEMCLIHEYQ